MLDAAHALMTRACSATARPPQPSLREERERAAAAATRRRSALQRSLAHAARPRGASASASRTIASASGRCTLPEENLLYFLEKYSPELQPWQREILRIVRNLAQYFYPQRQTKVMNEGCATFVHHHILNMLHEAGPIDEGAMLEFLHSHTAVVFQPEFDDPRYSAASIPTRSALR